MIKDFLVVASRNDGDDAAIATALALAERSAARVAVLICVPLAIPVTFGSAVPADICAQMQQRERERGAATAERVRRMLAVSAAASEVRVVESLLTPPSVIASMHARHADMAVVAGVSDEAPGWAEAVFLELLMDSGRPVLVVPSRYKPAERLRHAVVAWQPTREATRALHDSLPLLHGAETVDLLLVDPVASEEGHGREPGADIAIHLARHGLRVNLVSRPLIGETPGAVIVRHAVETGADLVIAGGYSHSRLREVIVGGATRTLLETCPVPLMLSR